MTDKRLRELERAAKIGDAEAEQALAIGQERAGRSDDARRTIEGIVSQARARLTRDHEDIGTRALIAQVDPYAWTGFIDIVRHDDRVELRVHEGTVEPTLVRSFSTKGKAHVLSCGQNLYVCDDEKYVCLGKDQGVRPARYGIPCTSVDQLALADAVPSCETRTVDAGPLGHWVGGDSPVRVLAHWRYVSVFHTEGQTILNITGYSTRETTHLAGNIVISDARIFHIDGDNWTDYDDLSSCDTATYQHARAPIAVPTRTRLSRNENRCSRAADLASLHEHTGRTLLVEAPITIIERLRALPEHFVAKRDGQYWWKQI